MNKRNILLDFTSLLDVIMIILFVVICKLGQASMEVNASAQEARAEAEAAQEQLEAARSSIEKLETRDTLQTQIIDELEARDVMQDSIIEELETENAELKAAAGEESFDRDKVLEELLSDSVSLQLICASYEDEEKSASNLVNITIYKDQGVGEMEAGRIVTFVHDFDLSPERRAVKNAQMQRELYEALYAVWKESEPDFLLITVEYNYHDPNFSKTDLDLINGAVEDLERECGVKCFINKVKR